MCFKIFILCKQCHIIIENETSPVEEMEIEKINELNKMEV
jgi:hypothetical protein